MCWSVQTTLGEHPVVERGAAELDGHRLAAGAVLGARRDRGDLGMQGERAQALRRPSRMRDEVALVRQQPRSSTCGSIAGSRVVIRTDAFAQGLVDRHRDAGAAPVPPSSAGLRLPAITIMSLMPSSREARAVADAAVGVAMGQRAGMRIGLEVEQRAQDRMVESGAHSTDRPVGHGLDAERLEPRPQARCPRRCSTAGEWIAPAHHQRLAPCPHRTGPAVADTHDHAVGVRPVALERQRVDHRVADDGQIRPSACRLEIAVVGRDAQACCGC